MSNHRSSVHEIRIPVADALAAPVRGFLTTMANPGLRKELGRALFVNCALAFVVIVAVLAAGWAATAGLVQGGGPWIWIGWLARLLGLLGLLLLAPVLFNGLASLVLPMVQERIFGVARRFAGGVPLTPGEGPSALSEAAGELRRFGRLLVIIVVPLPLLLVPFAGPLFYGLIQAVNGAWALGWDLLAMHFAQYGLSYEEQRRVLARNRLSVLGLGGVAGALGLVPLIQVLFLTTNIVGVGLLSASLDPGGER